jgi:NAD(P)-dependent dehydrogenase (short-subunit alcohol dehydrogenase family)
LADAGSAVAIGARSMDQLEEVAQEIDGRGGRVFAASLDVSDPVSVQRFVEAAVARFERVDVLVNNAGSNNGEDGGAVGPVWEINPEAWWHDIEINLRGTFLCTSAAIPHMIATGGGHIVNMVSMAAVMPWPYDTAYACSKAAVIRLTDSVAEEVRGKGIYLFALSPGSVDTELRAGAVESPAGRKWLTNVNPNPQWVPAELPAAAVVRLASGEADELTGRFLSIDWDLGALCHRAGDIVTRDALQLRLIPDDRT